MSERDALRERRKAAKRWKRVGKMRTRDHVCRKVQKQAGAQETSRRERKKERRKDANVEMLKRKDKKARQRQSSLRQGRSITTRVFFGREKLVCKPRRSLEAENEDERGRKQRQAAARLRIRRVGLKRPTSAARLGSTRPACEELETKASVAKGEGGEGSAHRSTPCDRGIRSNVHLGAIQGASRLVSVHPTQLDQHKSVQSASVSTPTKTEIDIWEKCCKSCCCCCCCTARKRGRGRHAFFMHAGPRPSSFARLNENDEGADAGEHSGNKASAARGSRRGRGRRGRSGRVVVLSADRRVVFGSGGARGGSGCVLVGRSGRGSRDGSRDRGLGLVNVRLLSHQVVGLLLRERQAAKDHKTVPVKSNEMAKRKTVRERKGVVRKRHRRQGDIGGRENVRTKRRERVSIDATCVNGRARMHDVHRRIVSSSGARFLLHWVHPRAAVSVVDQSPQHPAAHAPAPTAPLRAVVAAAVAMTPLRRSPISRPTRKPRNASS